MRLISYLRSLISTLFHRAQMDAEMEEELRLHIEIRADDLERSGLPRADAARRARIEFGGPERFKEEIRDECGGRWLETLWTDLRYAVRMLRKSPGFTAVAVLTLALGIGANTAIFTMTNGLMLHTLPVRDPAQLVEILHHYPGEPEPGFNGFSWDAYQRMRDGNHVLSDLIIGSLNVLRRRRARIGIADRFRRQRRRNIFRIARRAACDRSADRPARHHRLFVRRCA